MAQATCSLRVGWEKGEEGEKEEAEESSTLPTTWLHQDVTCREEEAINMERKTRRVKEQDQKE